MEVRKRCTFQGIGGLNHKLSGKEGDLLSFGPFERIGVRLRYLLVLVEPAKTTTTHRERVAQSL